MSGQTKPTLTLADVRPLPPTVSPDVHGMHHSERRKLAFVLAARVARVRRETDAIEFRLETRLRWLKHHDNLMDELKVCESAYAPRTELHANEDAHAEQNRDVTSGTKDA